MSKEITNNINNNWSKIDTKCQNDETHRLTIWYLMRKMSKIKATIANELCDSEFNKRIKRIHFKVGKI